MGGGGGGGQLQTTTLSSLMLNSFENSYIAIQYYDRGKSERSLIEGEKVLCRIPGSG